MINTTSGSLEAWDTTISNLHEYCQNQPKTGKSIIPTDLNIQVMPTLAPKNLLILRTLGGPCGCLVTFFVV